MSMAAKAAPVRFQKGCFISINLSLSICIFLVTIIITQRVKKVKEIPDGFWDKGIPGIHKDAGETQGKE